jgi:hypothetical protein
MEKSERSTLMIICFILGGIGALLFLVSKMGNSKAMNILSKILIAIAIIIQAVVVYDMALSTDQ